MFEKTQRMNRLYDYYHELLTEKQQRYLDLYYQEDYSLGEIASLFSVSRQAVHDNIHRSAQTLERYEGILHLLANDDERERIGRELLKQCEETAVDSKIMQSIRALLAVDIR